MDNKIILDLCGGSGAWPKPYSVAGYDVKLITLPNIDVCNYDPSKNVTEVLAAPPCTNFSFARRGKVEKNFGERNFTLPQKIYNTWEEVIKNKKLYIRKPRKKPNMIWLHKSSYDLIPEYHTLPRPKTDADFRGMTPQGFAKAFFMVNP